MNDLPRGARFFILVVFGLGVFVALSSSAALLNDPWLIIPTIALAALIAVFDLFVVSVRTQHSDMLLSSAIKLAAVMILVPPSVVPPSVLLLAIFFGTFFSERWLRRVWYKMIFNVGTLTITYLIVVAVYQLLNDPTPVFWSPFKMLRPSLCWESAILRSILC